MNRRSVIKNIGLGLSAGVVLPGWLSGCSDDPAPKTTYEGTVAIVGAGAAGLYAADILKAKGVKVVILEASPRVGGRVRTLKSTDKPSLSLLFNSTAEFSGDFPNELGATFVNGSDSVWGRFVQELNIRTVDLSSAPDNYILDGLFKEGIELASDPDFVAAKNFVDTLSSQPGSGTVESALAAAGINVKMFSILNAWLGNRYNTTNDRMGMQGLSEAAGLRTRDNKLLTLADNPMQDALLSRFNKVVSEIKVNTQVTKIDYSGATVEVSGIDTVSGETFSMNVEKVIVTVPISVLKKGHINFIPTLPSSKTVALATMDMDPAFRVLLDFKANFWGLSSGSLLGGTEGPEYFNGGVGRSTLSKTLSVSVAGAKAAAFSQLGKDAIPVIISELDAVFDGKASYNIRVDSNDNIISIIQDWSKEPYILGGTSFAKPGGMNNHREDLAEAVEDKLFFAGEATDTNGEFGTINGALLSGERAAQEIIEVLKL